jgi:SSS family solute:Na+ symporter
MDFYQKLKPKATPQQLMGIGRWITAIVMVLAVLWAPRIGSFDQLWTYLQSTLAWFSPPVVALFVMGLFFKRMNNQGAIACIVVGFLITVFVIMDQVYTWNLAPNFLYMAGIHFAVSAITMYVVSMMTAPPLAEKTDALIWTKAEYDKETVSLQDLPWYKNYRYQAIILLTIVALILVRFANF